MSRTQRHASKNENRPRRNEEHEDFFYSSFVFFASSRLFSEKMFRGSLDYGFLYFWISSFSPSVLLL
jgi:hypothetical protein